MKKEFFRFAAIAAVLSLATVLFASVDRADAKVGDVSTFLGRLYVGDGLDAKEAYLDNPEGLTADASCSLFIADTQDSVVRKIDGASNVMTTYAGTGAYGKANGVTTKASFEAPYDVELGPDGELYVLDSDAGSVRIVRNGNVTTWFAGLKRPTGSLLVGTTLYIGDTGNNRVIKATIPDGTKSLVATLDSPGKMAFLNGALFVANAKSTTLSKVDLSTGTVTTAKDKLMNLKGVTTYNGKIYFTADDRGMYNDIWQYDPEANENERLVNVVENEWYNQAGDILFCNDTMYVLFTAGSSVYTLDTDGTNPVRIAGKHRYGDTEGTRGVLMLGRPKAMALSNDKKKLFILENHKFVVYNFAAGVLSFIAGSPMDNWKDASGSDARMSGPTQIILSPDGKRIYFADRNNNRIRYLLINEARLVTLTGAGAINQFSNEVNGYSEGEACPTLRTRGIAGCAYFNRPMGIAVSKDGKTLYVADTSNNRIRAVDVATGRTRLIAGSGTAGLRDGVGKSARFKGPVSILLSGNGKILYVVDQGNHAIRQIVLSTKRVTKLFGSGKPGYRDGLFKNARSSYPDSLALGPNGTLYLSELGSQRIRQIDPAKKTVKFIAGSGAIGSTNGPAKKASFHNPKGLLRYGSYLLVADQINDMIRSVRI